MRDVDQIWRWTEDRRLAAADLLESLSEADWDKQSLCEAWRVRDVAAHLTLSARGRPATFLRRVIKAGGNINRFIRDDACARGNRAPNELVAELRTAAPSRHHPIGTKPVDPLVDVFVHTLDITTPLGMPPPQVASDAVKAAADRLWSVGFPFHARKRFAGKRLEMVDVDWAAGEGTPLRGPSHAVLLALAGRAEGTQQLTPPA